ncbi:glycosyltransferase family 2 protein [Primorskyibacter sp. 2E107]|uniref:glycosyltransferase family 2 protein n=1 Tax=Primorskyibacter sp. 2E107 TaxID=3403458 RepID=UPI003AF65E51
MPDSHPTWGTVSTVLEPPQVLLAFAAHHLQAGASEIHLYLDQPCPQLQEWVADNPRVVITLCDAAYWRREHGRDRPPDSRYRQILNAGHAYARTRCDWLAHVDGDEFFIRVPQILAFLRSRPQTVTAVTVLNAELVQLRGRPPKTIFDGVFRKPFPHGYDAAQRRVYGAGADFLLRGLSGHAIGKTFFRTGAGLVPDLHEPAPVAEWRDRTNPARHWFPRIGLLHVDGFTRTHWQAKLASRVQRLRGTVLHGHNPARTRQIEIFLQSGPEAPEVGALYDATRTLTLWQILLLLRYHKLLPARLRVSDALASQFPGVAVDLSPAAIDAAHASMHRKTA